MRKPTIFELRNRLSYCQDTGKLFWKIGHRRKRPGDEAGYLHPNGYVVVGLNGSMHGAHRIAFAIHYGKWPDLHIDHINGNRSDNRIKNLREASQSVNSQNRREVRKGKPLSYLGVRKNQGSKTFSASININGKDKWLGSYKTPELAHKAYMEAKAKHHKGIGAYAPMEEIIANRAA